MIEKKEKGFLDEDVRMSSLMSIIKSGLQCQYG